MDQRRNQTVGAPHSISPFPTIPRPSTPLHPTPRNSPPHFARAPHPTSLEHSLLPRIPNSSTVSLPSIPYPSIVSFPPLSYPAIIPGIPYSTLASDGMRLIAAAGPGLPGGKAAEALAALRVPWLDHEYDLYHLYLVQVGWKTRIEWGGGEVGWLWARSLPGTCIASVFSPPSLPDE